MKVDDDILKSVGFIGCRKTDGNYLLKGSVFLIGLEKAAEAGRVRDIVWVTARHVIDGIRNLGCTEVCVRLNTVAGGAKWLSTPIADWFYLRGEKTCDVAVYGRTDMSGLDHNVIGPDNFLTTDVQTKLAFGVTDEVLVVGLFARRAGNQRNVPIVRLGSVASLDDDEHVHTKLGNMPAYLIECRSIGGLSGSPVFVLTGIERSLNGSVAAGQPGLYLLGLIHGHYDVKDSDIDAFDAAAGLKTDQVNTGIAIVTPFRKLKETLEGFKVQRSRVPSIFRPIDNLGFDSSSDVSLVQPPRAKP